MKILLVIATHGNEKIGLKVAKEIEKLNIDNLVVKIGNEKALKLNKRYIDQDLNRSFPGKRNGDYEERRAFELSPIIKSADIVIDIHSTTSNIKDTLIVSKLNKEMLLCIKSIQPKYVIIMEKSKNSLISQAKIGISFEYGKDNSMIALKKIVLDIKKLLNHFGLIKAILPKNKTATKYFNVTSIVPKPKGYKLLNKIKNYTLVKKGTAYATNKNKKLIADEDFYPILFGEKNYKNYFGFKGKYVVKI